MAAHEVKPLRVAVVGGSGPSAERTFAPGMPSGPLSVGRQGDWAIDGRGVGALDGFFYFDGRELFACSRDAGAPLMLDGRPLGTSWEQVPLGAILVIGRTRLVVEDPTPAPDSSSTILTDLDAMRAPPVPAVVPAQVAQPSPAAPRPSARPAVPPIAPTKPSVGMFSSDEEHTRIGEVVASVVDSDDAPTAFLSSSVRDAVREGLAREPARASARPPVRHPSSAPPAALAPADAGPSHVLRVDSRAASTPPPVHPGGLQDGPFFHGGAPSGMMPLDPQSLPRLSGALPLYGASATPRGPATEPPREDPRAASASGGALLRLWAESSPVRKATIALLPLALGAFAFVMLAPAPEARRAAPKAAEAKAASPAPASPASASTAASPAAAPVEAEAVTPRLVGASSGLAKAPDGGVTLERRAADAVHAHRLDEAAVLYKELSAAEPRNGAFTAAAEVLARPATAPH